MGRMDRVLDLGRRARARLEDSGTVVPDQRAGDHGAEGRDGQGLV